jgi:poly(3-hydroxybutyrate) depolymerase
MLHRFDHVYVPASCRSGARCGLHIALHGCHQNEDQINEGNPAPSHRYLFAADAGYNEFAERNGIVVLYPQAAATGAAGGNPNGCWDWWGYNGVDYWQKDARQIRNLWKLVETLQR